MNLPENRYRPDWKNRYSRQIGVPGVGEIGQGRLAVASVLVIGAGGLGIPIVQYLASAGVGRLGIADNDVVSLSNLQRQPAYRESDVGQKKTEGIARMVRALNSSMVLDVHDMRVSESNIRSLVRDYDIVADATDNFAARYGINDACVLENKPMVYGSVFRYEGQVAVFNVQNGKGEFGPNFRDLFPKPPPPELAPNCAEAGVFGALPGIIGSIQAMEIIKWIIGTGDLLDGRMLLFDGARMSSDSITIPDTGARHEIHSVQFTDAACASDDVALISPEILYKWKKDGKEFVLIDVREDHEREAVHIGGHHIPQTTHSENSEHPDELTRVVRPDIPVVFYCRSGARSRQTVLQLQSSGDYPHLYNLEGGILAWIDRIDPNLPSC